MMNRVQSFELILQISALIGKVGIGIGTNSMTSLMMLDSSRYPYGQFTSISCTPTFQELNYWKWKLPVSCQINLCGRPLSLSFSTRVIQNVWKRTFSLYNAHVRQLHVEFHNLQSLTKGSTYTLSK